MMAFTNAQDIATETYREVPFLGGEVSSVENANMAPDSIKHKVAETPFSTSFTKPKEEVNQKVPATVRSSASPFFTSGRQPIHRAPSIAAARVAALEKQRQLAMKRIPPSLRILVEDSRLQSVSDTVPHGEGLSKRSRSSVGQASGGGSEKSPIPLAIYKYPPTTSCVDLFTFKMALTNRLSLLQYIYRESASHSKSRGSSAQQELWTESFCRSITARLEDCGFYVPNPTSIEELKIAAEQDRLSHFGLRLAFARDSTAQEWFVKEETRLLEIKLRSQRLSVQRKMIDVPPQVLELRLFNVLQPVLKLLEIDYEIVTRDVNNSDSAIRRLWGNISMCYSGQQHQRMHYVLKPFNEGQIVHGLHERRYFEIPLWPYLTPLVRRRHCYIHHDTVRGRHGSGGFGYVPLPEMETVLSSAYQHLLTKAISRLQEKASILETQVFSDPRVGPLLRFVRETYLGTSSARKTRTDDVECLTLETLEELSLRSFPPCMKRLYQGLKSQKHLKHWGRLQLWLFLKGCGMSLDDQLRWWRSVWADGDKFDKEIRYNIRHAYGQEGKRVDYTPFNCAKIMCSLPAPGTGEVHGCPFKHFDTEALRQWLLRQYRVQKEDLLDVLHLKDTHEYQLACLSLFRVTHPGSEGDGVGNHPNAYFQESCRHHTIGKPRSA